MEKFDQIKNCVDQIEKDAQKFFQNGNKAAGTRARKHLQELKLYAQVWHAWTSSHQISFIPIASPTRPSTAASFMLRVTCFSLGFVVTN
mmetsp:Transcript_10354/g.20876  ORF Transcript_10354/g.20876 Transcript_10354/m.20876 type:complete len:89 (+) Transcript_10354:238-504(+)